ncbi:MAG: DUF4340 domain-containing protein [Bacteroidales bacterium]|nr:DUF4340 domain-containing protein [Bacteroidales bacterium]
MKRKNLIIIAIVILVAVAAVLVAVHGARKSTFRQDYHIKDISSVTQIFMADMDENQVLLQRPPKGSADTTWIVNKQYPANQPMIDLLLETLHTMRIREQVNRNAVPNIIARISSGNIKVEVYQRRYLINLFDGRVKLFPTERKTVTYYVGGETQDLMASYMFRDGDKVPYIIHIPGFRGFLTPRFTADPTKWRSHKIVDLDVKHIARISLDIPQMPNESFAIERNGEGFEMHDAAGTLVHGFDTARVAQMLSSFTNLNFDEYAEIVPHSNAANDVATGPRAILRITDTDGTTTEVKTYIKYTNPDDLMAMPDPEMYEEFDLNRLYAIVNQSDTVLIQYYAFDNILQPASYFRGSEKSFFAR